MSKESRGRHHNMEPEDTSLDLYSVEVVELLSTIVEVRANSRTEAEALVNNGKGIWGHSTVKKRLPDQTRALRRLPAEKCCNTKAITREQEEALCAA